MLSDISNDRFCNVATFSALDDYKTITAYFRSLRKALAKIEQDKSEPFLYLSEFLYDATPKPITKPLFIVDFAATLATHPGNGKKWTAKGTAGLTSQGKIKLNVVEGRVNTTTLRKWLKELSPSFPELEIDPNEMPIGQPNPDLPLIKQPPTHQPLRLPVAEGSHLDFVLKYIQALEKAKLPVDDAKKERALQTALQHFKGRDFSSAMTVLNDLAKDVTYPDVAAWVLDQPSRRQRVETVTEQYTALLVLLQTKGAQSRTAKGAPDRLATTHELSLTNLRKRIEQVGSAMGLAVEGVDPTSVKKHYDEWVLLEKARDRYREVLNQYWHNDQALRLAKENRALPNQGLGSDLFAMAEQYGHDETLELAQMAEIQAISYQRKNNDKKDPIAQARYDTILNVGELASIFSYSTADYTIVNKMLRNKPNNQADRDEINSAKKKFTAYVECAKSGLKKLPIYNGEVFRSNKKFWQEFIDEITKTGKFTEPSFMSAAKQKASGFGSLDLKIISNKTGRDISMFSLHQTEGEILFPPGGRFKFLGAEVLNLDFSNLGGASGQRIWENCFARTLYLRTAERPDADRLYRRTVRI